MTTTTTTRTPRAMLAMTLNSLRVQPDEFSAAGPSRLAALVSSSRGS
jgi:hypothetical protein